MVRDIGIDVKVPEEECKDEKCPFHGHLKIRGRLFEGEVISLKSKKTAIIRRDYLVYVPKYERYERRSSKIAAYLPECIKLKVGDKVRIAECRPLSKTKRHVVIEKL